MPKVEFDSYVEKTPTCWLWVGPLNGHGYGRFSQGRAKGRTRAHRFSFERVHGPIPPGMCILHKCDVRNCVNPEHLTLGTQLENIADMLAKGRGAPPPPPTYGEANYKTKLAAKDVTEIRRLYAAGWTQAAIGARYGMPQNSISNITLRRTWAHVP